MGSLIDKLISQGLITPPKFFRNNVHYECVVGSTAYGVSSDNSDVDVYGFVIPPKDIVFSHLSGEIQGFGKPIKRFDQFQPERSVESKDGRTKYDLAIYNIVKYFQLCMNNNPNIIDSLFVPRRCILHSTQIGEHVRENRKLFLHKGAWFRFKGYAYIQMHNMSTKNPKGKRKEMVEKYGYDVKFAYHVVRLLNEIEQILTEGDLDLERNREQLKSIRRGEWEQKQIVEYFETKKKSLEELYTKSKLQHSPDEAAIKALLLECLEMHYGSLEKAICKPFDEKQLLKDLETLVYKYS